ncbi:MAG: hypothetical protein FJX72_06465 [Armatimonadetes bacterium]|nr:hypothetical protein [Armatimonadota bacterium]
MAETRRPLRAARGAVSKPLLLAILGIALVAAVVWSVTRTRAVTGPAVGSKVPIDIEKVREQMKTEGFGRRK